MDDIFRRFFGFSGPHHNRPYFRDEEDGDDDNDGFSFFGGDSKDPFEDSFFHFNDHIQKQMDAMSRQMEDIFRNFGSVQFPSEFDGEHGSLPQHNPRDHMLKPSDPAVPGQEHRGEIVPIHPPRIMPPRFGRFPGLPHGDSEEKKDTDLDEMIKGREDLGKLFDRDKIVPHMPGPTSPVPHMPGSQMPFSWSKGFSRSFSRTFKDGQMEEVETIRHSDGSTEKIVRQKHGDKTHTTTFRTDKDGHTEKSETFQNMDEKDLPAFNEGWSQGRQPMINSPPSEPSVPGLSQDDKNFFKNLFGFDFWKSK